MSLVPPVPSGLDPDADRRVSPRAFRPTAVAVDSVAETPWLRANLDYYLPYFTSSQVLLHLGRDGHGEVMPDSRQAFGVRWMYSCEMTPAKGHFAGAPGPGVLVSAFSAR